MYFRNCSSCTKELQYKTKKIFLIAEKNNTRCKACVGLSQRTIKNYTRNCYVCQKQLTYKNHKVRNRAERLKMECYVCSGLRTASYAPRTEEVKLKCRLNNLGKTRSKKTRERCSVTKSKAVAIGLAPSNGRGNKTWHFSTKSNEKFYAESDLEKYIMESMDSDVLVVDWTKRHKIRIRYKFQGNRYYVPDFLVNYYDGSKGLIEVKGEENEKQHAKYNALVSFCKKHNWSYRWLRQSQIVNAKYRQWLKEKKKKQQLDV